jgi:hypothetical protein
MRRSPQHSEEYVARRELQLEIIDNSTPVERELISEYGFDRALPVLRQYYGRWDEAREVLETQRKALQVKRWWSILPLRVS